MRDYLILH